MTTRIRLDAVRMRGGELTYKRLHREGAGQLPSGHSREGRIFFSRADLAQQIERLRQLIEDHADLLALARALAADPSLSDPAALDGTIVTVDLTSSTPVVISP